MLMALVWLGHKESFKQSPSSTVLLKFQFSSFDSSSKVKFFQNLWLVLKLFHDVGLHLYICTLQPHISEAGERQVVKGWSSFPLNITPVQVTRLLLAGDGNVLAPKIICNITSDKAQGRIVLIEPIGIRQQARILKPSESLFSPLKKIKKIKKKDSCSCPCVSKLCSSGLLTPLTSITDSISLD